MSSRIRWGPIFFKINKIGSYRLVLDNTHSTITPKTVIVSGSLATKPLASRPKSTAEPLEQFTFPDVHEKIRKVSLELFRNGHYSQAIFEAVKRLEKEIKNKSGVRDKIGVDLVNHVFKKDHPIIKIVDGDEQENIDEREGFRFLYMGAFLGIKNPKSHSIQNLDAPDKALEYLAFLSLLMKRLDESVV